MQARDMFQDGHRDGQDRSLTDRRDSTRGSRRESLPLLGMSETSIRHGFIQKVYGILCMQLVLTTVLGATVMHYGRAWAKTNPTLVMTMLYTSLAVSVGMMFVFMCCPDTMRKTPTNYIMLLVFTLAESVLIGFVSIQYTANSVLMVFGITAFVVFSLTLFACQTTIDFTGMGPYLFCAVMVLMGFGFMISIAGWTGVGGQSLVGARLCYAVLGTLIFSAYLVFDTQLIVGGKHVRFQFGIDDYAMAAITLYIDIVQLFMMLLQLFGKRR